MKAKFTLVAVLIAAFFTGFGQAYQVPNGSFENWTTVNTLTTPNGWSDVETSQSVPFNVFTFEDTTTFTQGHASVEIFGDSTALAASAGIVPGFISLGTTVVASGTVNFVGVPFAFRPDTFVFDFMLHSPNADTAFAQVFMTNSFVNTILGLQIPLTVTNGWVHAAIPLASFYLSGGTPDTLQIQFFSTNPQKAVNHDTLHVDGVRFGYVATPATISASITAAGATTICTGDSVKLMANTGTNYTYQWSMGGTAITGATGANFWAKLTGTYTVTIDSMSVTATSNAITVTDSTCHHVGINNISAAELSVYPNPATSLLNINSNTDLTGFNVQMFDIVGRLVISQVLEGHSNTINVAKLANGTYIYRVTDKENGVVTQSKLNVIK